MDYNDIQDRLKKTYASIGEQFSYGHSALDLTHTEKRQKTRPDGKKEHTISISFFDPNDESKVRNQINSVIANLANIKDCLKNKLKKRGDDPKLIEDEINNEPHLQVIIDLANQEKHGYPLTRTKRSGKDPLIQNVGRALSPSNKPDNTRYERSDGAAIQNAMVKVTADITDAQGNDLYKLDDLVEGGLSAWDRIIKKYNIT